MVCCLGCGALSTYLSRALRKQSPRGASLQGGADGPLPLGGGGRSRPPRPGRVSQEDGWGEGLPVEVGGLVLLTCWGDSPADRDTRLSSGLGSQGGAARRGTFRCCRLEDELVGGQPDGHELLDDALASPPRRAAGIISLRPPAHRCATRCGAPSLAQLCSMKSGPY